MTFAPGGSALHGSFTLHSGVVLSIPDLRRRLPGGGDGAVAALTLRNQRGAVLWRVVELNVPGFAAAIAISADRQLSLRPGTYTFDLAGKVAQGITLQATGLAREYRVTAVSRGATSVRMLASSDVQPVASAWLDTVRSPTQAAGIVIALASDTGPGSSGTENLCVTQSVATPTCITPSFLGSHNNLSGPFIPPLPWVATWHEHAFFLYFNPLSIPRDGLVFRGAAAAGTGTWHGVIELKG